MYYYSSEYESIGQLLGGIIGGLVILFLICLAIVLAIGIIELVAKWKLYKKAGKGGWEAIVPFYTNWVLVEIAGLKWYWFLFFFAPLVLSAIDLGFIGWLAYLFAIFNIFYNLSKKFNKGIGFAICGTLFTPICIMILGFSKQAIYNKDIPVSEHGVFEQTNSANPQSTDQSTFNKTSAFCKNCGSKVESNASFCKNCGTSLINKDTCLKCGNKIKKDDKFCTNCGTKI